MKSISRWAARNVFISRLIIVMGSIFLYFYTAFFGFILNRKTDFDFADLLLLLVFALLIIGFIGYPSRTKIKSLIKQTGFYFKGWKVYDLVLIIAFSILGLHFGHELENQKISDHEGVSTIVDVLSFSPVMQVTMNQKNDLSKKVRINRFLDKLQQKLIHFFNKKFLKLESSHNAELGAFIILFVAIYVLLFYGLASLACNIACNGNDALALLVFVAGQVLLFLGLYAAIFGIKNWLERNDGGGVDLKKNRRYSLVASLVVSAIPYLIVIIGNAFD